MNTAIRFFLRHSPRVMKKQELRLLFDATAQAFACDTPQLKSLSYEKLLEQFCYFTNEQAQVMNRLPHEEREAGKERLRRETRILGQKLRRTLKIQSQEDAQTVVVYLYKNIGIYLDGSIPGEFQIRTCYFSKTYSPEVCDFISALDEGIMQGLLRGGSLQFSERITEGKACCKGCFSCTVTKNEATL